MLQRDGSTQHYNSTAANSYVEKSGRVRLGWLDGLCGRCDLYSFCTKQQLQAVRIMRLFSILLLVVIGRVPAIGKADSHTTANYRKCTSTLV